ncbi:MAG: hypothetical protein ACNA8W_09250, partial [Bradymonadaceae bacterium]
SDGLMGPNRIRASGTKSVEKHPAFGAIGVGVGAAVGTVVALTRPERPIASSVEYMMRDVPRAVQAPVLNLSF